jgi:hypothetical protein
MHRSFALMGEQEDAEDLLISPDRSSGGTYKLVAMWAESGFPDCFNCDFWMIVLHARHSVPWLLNNRGREREGDESPNTINQEVVKGTSAPGAEPLPSARQRARSAAISGDGLILVRAAVPLQYRCRSRRPRGVHTPLRARSPASEPEIAHVEQSQIHTVGTTPQVPINAERLPGGSTS